MLKAGWKWNDCESGYSMQDGGVGSSSQSEFKDTVASG